MSHTVIDTPETQGQKIENIRNECKRHCRIGRVKVKPHKGWIFDHHLIRAIMPESRKCSCPPGTVCNNVACPHLPVVTCSTAH